MQSWSFSIRLERLAGGKVQEVVLTRPPVLDWVCRDLELDHPSTEDLKVCTRDLFSVVDKHVNESSQDAYGPDGDGRIEVVPAAE